MNKIILTFLCFMLVFFAINASFAEALVDSDKPIYEISLVVIPAEHKLLVSGSISNLPQDKDLHLYLNNNFHIESFLVDGKSISLAFDKKAKSPPYVDVAKPLCLSGRPKKIEFKYSGEIAATISNVNMINSDLVELASYSAWYPFSPDINHFSYRTHITLPKSFKIVSSGKETARAFLNTTQTVTFDFSGNASDIPIVASPKLITFRKSIGSLGVEMLSSSIPQKTADNLMGNMAAALVSYETMFGNSGISGIIRFVYSPRAGWGYSRIPLFVVPEQYKTKQLNEKYDVELDFHGNVHELAHFWWQIADSDLTEDWINEGLAEYSAFLVSTKKFKTVFRDYLLKQYHDDVQASLDDISILETTADSPARYVNRYEKTTLMFYELQKKFGKERIENFLKRFFSKYRGTINANTNAFLALAKEDLGEKAKSYLEFCLNKKGMKEVPTFPL